MIQWQDWVLAVTVAAFNIALIPSIVGKDKPRLATSVLTASFLIPQAIVFFSLSLWYSFIMACINTLLWIVLAIQKRRAQKHQALH